MAENIKVMVRIRPLLSFEQEPIWVVKQNSLFTVNAIGHSQRSSSSDKKGRENKKEVEYQFNFQSVAEELVTSQQIYKREIKATLINSYHSGRNVSIMAYGQTCSGKTHTILGIKEAPGIIPCVLRDLFVIKNEKERKCSFKISYVEIYNEKLYDLLETKEKSSIKIVQSPTKSGYEIAGAMKEPIARFEDALKLLERGEKKRQYGQGQHHERSSRSHTLLSIYIDEWDDNYAVKSFVFTIVDLAGSQRLTNSQQSTTEAGYINKSLFQLTNCVSKLSEKAPHIPFRDSKLTMLLEASLTGTGRSFIICCISPSRSCFGETLSTLRLAERAKRIQLKEPIEQLNDAEIDHLRVKLKEKSRQCSELKKQIQRLHSKIESLEYEITTSSKKKHKQEVKANLLILLDHQNFTLFLDGHIDQSYTNSKAYQKLKERFVQSMQQLYETFTKEIISHAYGDAFELQIEQLCFMNMVLEHDKIMNYKIDIIGQLLKEKNSRESQENSVFYHSLQQYQNKLKMNCSSDNMRSFRSSNHEYLYENNSFSIGSREILQSQSKFLSDSKSTKGRAQCGSEVLVWGCKKDFRVCKGEANKLNMIRINHLGKISAVVCGYHHTLAVLEDGRVFGWGKNTEKQINQSNRESISAPTQLKQLRGIKALAAGWGHSLALTYQGRLYSWGYGKDGQLGLGNNNNSESPKQLIHKSQISSIYAGHSHSAFIDAYGDMYTFGFNQDYRLMIDEYKEVNEPKKITIREVVKASLGVSHSMIITANGCVYGGGTGRNGELGVHLNQNWDGWEKMEVVDRKFQDETYEKICPLVKMERFDRNNRAKDVRCGQNMTIILNEKGEVYTFGKTLSHRIGHSNNYPTAILQDIEAIQCGSRNGFALNYKQNKLYSWGFNMYGQANPQTSGDIETPQLIQGISGQRILSISSGFFHSAMLLQ